LTKDDDICTFILNLPDAAEPAAKPVADAHPEAKIARLYGVLYQFLAKAMLENFGAEGEEALRNALGDYARHEAESLNEDQLARGWKVHGSELRLGEGYSTISGQAVYDAWCEVEGDETPIGLIYFEEVHQAT
jgi:hypothetical protein